MTRIPVQDAGFRALALMQPTVRLVKKMSAESNKDGKSGDNDAYWGPLPFEDKSGENGTGNGDSISAYFRNRNHERMPSVSSEGASATDGESVFSCTSSEVRVPVVQTNRGC